jgi:hypothetical protein
MGLATKRTSNRATHVVILGDGLSTLACRRHAEMLTAGSAAFAFETSSLPGLMFGEMSDNELRNALQIATYERRAELREATRRFDQVRRRDIESAVLDIFRRGVEAVALSPPIPDEDRSPELEPPRTESAS